MDDHFEGYAFVGAHYVYGAAGRDRFQADTGMTLGPNEDGCYVLQRRNGQALEIGTDAQGLGRLFLYRSRTTWVLCSSYSGLVDHLRERGHQLTLVSARLRPFGVKNSFTMQLTTFRTPFEEITLLPVGSVARVVDNDLTISREASPGPADLSSAMSEYLSVWRSRACTLIRDDRVTFTADITGGLDSRTVLAFLIGTGNFDTSNPRFGLNSTKNQAADLASASAIARAYGLDLNGPRRQGPMLGSDRDAFNHWREHSLGVYTPVYTGTKFQGPLEIHAHGGGGETNRQYYKQDRAIDLLSDFTGKMPGSDFQLWAREIGETEIQLEKLAPGIRSSQEHYRQFRNRFHFGHIPKARPLFTPLNSKLISPEIAKHYQGRANQFYHDVVESLVPGLSDLPYDSEKKAPTRQEKKERHSVKLAEVEVGQVYISSSPAVRKTDVPAVDPYQLWIQEVARAASNRRVQNFVMGNAMKRADALVGDLVDKGTKYHSHSSEAIQLSYLVMVSFAFGGDS